MKTKTNSRPRYWLGLGGKIAGDSSRQLFKAADVPTPGVYSFAACIGPFRTKRGAIFMRDHGQSNPHCQCVNDAERIAAGFAYDVALRKWVRTRAAARLAGKEIAS